MEGRDLTPSKPGRRKTKPPKNHTGGSLPSTAGGRRSIANTEKGERCELDSVYETTGREMLLPQWKLASRGGILGSEKAVMYWDTAVSVQTNVCFEKMKKKPRRSKTGGDY